MRASDWHPVASSTSSLKVSVGFHHELTCVCVLCHVFVNWFVSSSPGGRAGPTGSLMHVLLRLLQPAGGLTGAEV